MNKCTYRRLGHHALLLTLEGIPAPVAADEPIAWWNTHLAPIAEQMMRALRPVVPRIAMTSAKAADGTLIVSLEIHAKAQREDKALADDMKAQLATYLQSQGIAGDDTDKGHGGQPDKQFSIRGIDHVYANLRKIGVTPPEPPAGTKSPLKRPPRPPKKGAGT